MTAIDHLRALIREELELFLESYASGKTILTEDCNLVSFEMTEIPGHVIERVRLLFKDVSFFVNGLSDDGITLCSEEPKDPLLAYVYQSLMSKRIVKNFDYYSPNTILLSSGINKHCGDYVPFQLIRNDTPGYQDIYDALIELLNTLANIFSFGIKIHDDRDSISSEPEVSRKQLGYL